MDISSIRYFYDRPDLYGVQPVERAAAPAIHGRALSQQVRLSAGVLPRVFNSVQRARTNLGISGAASAFVYASPETNAHCYSDEKNDSLLLFISSALVKLLTERELDFIIGHELGHHLFAHFKYPGDEDATGHLRLLELRRAAEISADRTGLLACRDLDIALSATLKVASGLDAAHLEIDIRDYVRQVRELKEAMGDESLVFSTHPSFPLRARALLRFDSIVQLLLSGQTIESELRETDERIRRDLDHAAAGASGNRFSEIATTAAFWRVACHLCTDGQFSTSKQNRMAAKFGRDKVDALKRTLSTCGKAEGLAFLETKRAESEQTLSDAPLFVVQAANELFTALG